MPLWDLADFETLSKRGLSQLLPPRVLFGVVFGSQNAFEGGVS